MQNETNIRQILKAKNETYRTYGLYHYDWLRRIGQYYKDEGIIPYDAFVLSSYYPDMKDKEVSFFIAMNMQYEKDDTMSAVLYAKELIGEHPYHQLKERLFIHWHKSEVNPMIKRKILRYERAMEYAYTFYQNHDWKPLREVVEEMPTPINVSLEMIFSGMPCPNKEMMSMQLAIILTTNDGFGQNLWNACVGLHNFTVPSFPKMNKFLSIFYPLYAKEKFAIDGFEVMSFIGLDSAIDLFYSYLAYERLYKTHPEEMDKFISRWLRTIGEDRKAKRKMRINKNVNAYATLALLKKSLPPLEWIKGTQ